MKKLKNKQKTTISSILFTMLIMILFLFQSCETEVPDTDTEPPIITFQIVGEGINSTFSDEDTTREIYLTNGAAYNFTFTVTDSGGVSEMAYRFDPTFMVIESQVPNSWRYNSSTVVSSANYYWTGDENNPTTGFVFTGTFRVNGDEEVFNLDLWGYDFGGESGNPNFRGKTYRLKVGQDLPLVGPFI